MSTTVADPRFPQADQWISEVGGDSVNQLGILDGDLVHCVWYEAARGAPQTGDIVEVERIRYQGALRELTVKQVEVVGNQIRLWPRSTNTRWTDPIVITDGAVEGEEMEVYIRGLVLAVIRRL
jgi:SOS-response transcriptional repressor LexA